MPSHLARKSSTGAGAGAAGGASLLQGRHLGAAERVGDVTKAILKKDGKTDDISHPIARDYAQKPLDSVFMCIWIPAAQFFERNMAESV